MKIKRPIALTSLVLVCCSDENLKIRGQFIANCVQGDTPKSLKASNARHALYL